MDQINNSSVIKIHFIIGSGRSGTSLLVHILNNHKNCISPPLECSHLLLFYKKYHTITEVTVDLINDAKKYLSSILKMEGIPNYLDYIHKNFPFTIGESINYFEFCKRIYFILSYYKKDISNVTTIIDKNPGYTLQVDKLNEILPDAKFLCLLRDYRAYVLSNIQNPEYYVRHLPVQYHSLVWRFYNKLILKIKDKYQNKVGFFKYEDFITNKEKVFEKICIFFGIENDSNSFNYQEEIASYIDVLKLNEKAIYQRASVLKPVNQKRLESWKEAFTDFQMKIIEFWCGKTGEKFNYERSKKVNLLESIIIIIISLPYYIRVWMYFKLKYIRLIVYLSEGRKAKYLDLLNKKLHK